MNVDEHSIDESLSLYAGLLNKVLFIKARVADKQTNKVIEDLQRTVEWMRDEHIAHNIEVIERGQGV
tara:strand:- start:77 stop:277 length:201 start_codon:yes stop_codon:yes gene_type:complete